MSLFDSIKKQIVGTAWDQVQVIFVGFIMESLTPALSEKLLEFVKWFHDYAQETPNPVDNAVSNMFHRVLGLEIPEGKYTEKTIKNPLDKTVDKK